jgi:hypothetical protein
LASACAADALEGGCHQPEPDCTWKGRVVVVGELDVLELPELP